MQTLCYDIREASARSVVIGCTKVKTESTNSSITEGREQDRTSVAGNLLVGSNLSSLVAGGGEVVGESSTGVEASDGRRNQDLGAEGLSGTV